MISDIQIGEALDEVRETMAQALLGTPLSAVVEDTRNLLGAGKMLRARLILRIGEDCLEPRTLKHCGAAVELIHGASLLHDDVIDGGFLRRSAPTFWVERGVSGAILLGDLMLFRALDLLVQVHEEPLLPHLIRLTGQVCEAEAEQELVLRGHAPTWDNCLSIARRKTGALFAFAARVGGGSDARASDLLEQSGSDVGTAYQLSDDLLDASGNLASGKTLGTDAARNKTTAGTAGSAEDASELISALCRQATERLQDLGPIGGRWAQFMDHDLLPALKKNTGRPLPA